MNPNKLDDVLNAILNEKSNKTPGHERYEKSDSRKKLVKGMVKKYDEKNPNSRELRDKKNTAKRYPKGETAKEFKKKGIDVNATCQKANCNKKAQLDHANQSNAAYKRKGIPSKTNNLCSQHHTLKTREEMKKLGKNTNQHGKLKNKSNEKTLTNSKQRRRKRRILSEATSRDGALSRYGAKSSNRSPSKGRAKKTRTQVGGPHKEGAERAKVEISVYRHPKTPKILVSPKGIAEQDFRTINSISRANPTYYSITEKKR